MPRLLWKDRLINSFYKKIGSPSRKRSLIENLFIRGDQPIFSQCSTYIPGGFLMFSGGIEVEHWLKTG